MATFNLFKISNLKQEEFLDIYQPDSNEKTKVKTLTIDDNQVDFFVFSDIESSQPTELSWSWLVQQAELQTRQMFKLPKAILYTIYNEEVYALTFGMAYSDVDKYADKDFAFKFARKFNYKKIKSKPYGWKYGINKSVKIKAKEKVKQYACDFYGNKEVIKTI